MAWNLSNADSQTHPVGLLAQNELGLYDMTGNVFEWCRDWRSTTIDQEALLNQGMEQGTDYVGPYLSDTGSPLHILHGGCWENGTDYSAISLRANNRPETAFSTVGLRLVLK